jgi:hypothetical protein
VSGVYYSAEELEEHMQELNDTGIDPYGLLLVDANDQSWMAFGRDDAEEMSCWLISPAAFAGNSATYLPADQCDECGRVTPYVPLETATYPVTVLWEPVAS